ncbi:U3 small nucleolar RNA-associated protein 14 homolog A [Manacus vitellinus]|uniref:U3 small nucleolar RNA-associated protein 14 homolog A n=1 Tax=Manacus vitellinus TaxID=328815 RepID=UPI00115DDFB7|nr:U3 small nucleolar RNA-associated protein 14 homolog A [Manacus vitellinus]
MFGFEYQFPWGCNWQLLDAQARTPLEQEIFGLLHKTQQPITDPLLTPEETASLKAMSLEEARRRRAELQKARAVQSYYEAKARREKRIKSKKYHRVLKKSRRRQALKEFEQLHKSDPAAALARLEELEQLRMQERMSLKHQNKGKWARSRAIMAKYDLEARKAMQEQLARNKELMQKVQVEPPEEEPCEVPEEDPAAVPIPTRVSTANPWMLGKPSAPAPEPEAQEAPRDGTVPGAAESKEEIEEEEEEELSEEEALLQDFEQKRQARQERAGSPEGHGAGETEASAERPGDSPIPPFCAEEPVSMGLEPPPQAQEQLLLSEQLHRVQTMEDVEGLAKEEPVEEQEKPVAPRAGKQVQQQKERTAGDRHAEKTTDKKMISLEAVLDGKPQEMDCPSLPVVVEEEEGGIDQRGMITEAFAGDDVVADFVSELPFPFERHQQFEQSIRTPVGTTWNTQRAFQKLTAPRVVTRAGHIIQPISAEDVPDTAPSSGASPREEALPRGRAPSRRRPHRKAR